MNKSEKINFLYKYAHGQTTPANREEKALLKTYKVNSDDGNYATKVNITAYVKEVDKGYRLSFYDWCMNNCRADRRRKGSSIAEMKSDNRWDSVGSAMLGWLIWGMAIYWIFDGNFSVGVCAILGIIITVILQRLNRRMVGFNLFLLPIILIVLFGHYI